jgi:hypothetical protein
MHVPAHTAQASPKGRFSTALKILRRSRRASFGGPPVRSPRCSTCPSVPASAPASLQRLTCPRQRSFEPGSKTGIRASYTRTTREEFPVLRPRFPAAFRPPGIRFLGTLSCQGVQPPLRSAYRTACAYPRLGCGPIAGFTRSARMRPGPGRPPSIPREQRCPHGQGASPAAACRISAACPCHPGRTTQPRMYASRGISKGFLVVALPVHSPRLWPPWLERRPSGFSVSSAPDRSGTGHARHGGDRSNTTCCYVSGISQTSLTSTLTTCDLVSQHSPRATSCRNSRPPRHHAE